MSRSSDCHSRDLRRRHAVERDLMDLQHAQAQLAAAPARPWRLYYGWMMVAVASTAMVATFPGRTHGLGVITERVLEDPALGLSRTGLGYVNLWATLVGALFCVGCGPLIDRFGVRAILPATLVALGFSVIAMNASAGVIPFFVGVTLTRGFGQSALSVVSLSIVGKWFRRRLNWAVSAYTVLVGVGFMAAFAVARKFATVSWRSEWGGIGVILLALAPLAWLVARNRPEDCGLVVDGNPPGEGPGNESGSELEFTVTQAIASPAFWVFGVATSLFGLVVAGVSTFNQSILADRGFPEAVYYDALSIGAGVGIMSNLSAGWLISRARIARVTALALLTLSGALVALNVLATYRQVVAWTIVNAMLGGVITVVFFAVWPMLYGRRHLGKIQGAAQMLTVLASAIGPLIFGLAKDRAGAYAPALYSLAGATAVVAIVAWFVPLPHRASVRVEQSIVAAET